MYCELRFPEETGPLRLIRLPLVKDDPIIMGRSSRCHVGLADHYVSRVHCHLAWEQGALVVVNLSTTNRTYVNGLPVQRHILQAGDRIELGDVCVQVSLVSSGPVPGQHHYRSDGAETLDDRVLREDPSRSGGPTSPGTRAVSRHRRLIGSHSQANS